MLTNTSYIGHNGFGQISQLTYGNGTITDYSYATGNTNKATTLMGSTVNAKEQGASVQTPILSRDYTYNKQGMVRKMIRNVAGSLLSQFGTATFTDTYAYDRFGRLDGHEQLDGSSSIYTLDMDYNKAGSITFKSGNGSSFMNATALTYDLQYHYDPSKDHQLDHIWDPASGTNTTFTYNTSGSVTRINDPSQAIPQDFFWNEQQQLTGVKNQQGVHHYVYDHQGERLMKSSLINTSVYLNDQVIDNVTNLDPYTVYVNPFYVVTGLLGGDRVSKHYYMNQQRVATDITINYDPNGGSGGEYAPSKGLDDLKKVVQELNHEPLDTSILELPSLTDYYPETATAKSSSSQAEGAGSSGRILFWYHPDYLGNVDLVTEIDGFAHEFFIYNPWGEEMHQWNANTYAFTSPYRFNSKELDPETGLAYYGARYYQNKMGVWLSVDPMATKFHSLTPFHFVANNPINIVDPNGLDTHFVDNQARSDFKAAQAQVNQRVAKLHAAVDRDNQLANQKGVLPGLSRFLRSENRHKRELNDWKKLQNDFDNICNPNTRLVSYQSGNVPEKADGTTDGETSVAILVKVKPGYLSTYIHENRHVNQIMNGTTGIGGSQGNTDWFDEIEAFQYQQIFNFQDVQQKLEASAAKHGQLSFTIEEMVKREYLEPHYIKSTSDIK